MSAAADHAALQRNVSDRDALAFGAAHLELPGRGGIDVELTLQANELGLLLLDDPLAPDALIDAICGLEAPVRGSVRVLGHSWDRLPVERANALRGRIGRVGTEPVFPAGTAVGDSVVLGPLFHTTQSEADVKAEAAQLARSFGLPGLPLGMPAELTADDLVRADCVRALLGPPRLLLVDERAGGFPAELVTALINAARGLRARGGAVLWLTQVPARPADGRFPATQCLELRDGQVHTIDRAGESEGE